MMLQGLNSNMHNLSAVPFRDEDSNCAKNQLYGEVSKEVKSGADINGDGITDSTSAHVAGDAHVFVSNVFPGRNTVHGNFL